MSDNIVKFPKQKKVEIHGEEISHCLNTIVELTQSRGGILFLLKHNEDAATAWTGDMTTQDMVRLCSLGIYDAYALEKQDDEEEPF